MTEHVPDKTGRKRWFGLFFISLGVAVIIVDSTIVNVAIPSIIDDIGLTSSGAQWVQEIYTLIFAALLLVWGRMADEWGRRRLFIVGVVIFALSSVLAAMAPSGELLIAARAVQGIGGSMMLPTSLSILNATFRGKERGIAFAFWGATIGGMAALGPLLGGWLTTSFSCGGPSVSTSRWGSSSSLVCSHSWLNRRTRRLSREPTCRVPCLRQLALVAWCSGSSRDATLGGCEPRVILPSAIGRGRSRFPPRLWPEPLAWRRSWPSFSWNGTGAARAGSRCWISACLRFRLSATATSRPPL